MKKIQVIQWADGTASLIPLDCPEQIREKQERIDKTKNTRMTLVDTPREALEWCAERSLEIL